VSVANLGRWNMLTRAMFNSIEGAPRLDNTPPHMVELSLRPLNVSHLGSRLIGQAAKH
jgi:hypothetical protein